jgi:hypothetical protein
MVRFENMMRVLKNFNSYEKFIISSGIIGASLGCKSAINLSNNNYYSIVSKTFAGGILGLVYGIGGHVFVPATLVAISVAILKKN